MNAIGLIFANMHDNYIPELTKSRTLSSLPFGGRYRLIDFTLSNMVNSNIAKVGVTTRQNYHSLMDHLSGGKDWDLSRRMGGLFLIPPYGTAMGQSPNSTRLQALESSLNFLQRSEEEYVVIADGDCVCNMDYDDMLKHHLDNNNDVTIAYKPMCLDEVQAQHISGIKMDKAGRVVDLLVPNRETGKANAVLNVYILRRELLIKLINSTLSRGQQDFKHDMLGKNLRRLKIGGYAFNNVFFFIDSLTRYYECNMMLLNASVRDALFNVPYHSIYTKVKDSAPTKYFKNAKVCNSYVADGCEIEGTVINSILFRDCKIHKGALVENSIIMQDSEIGENVHIEYVLTDKKVVIRTQHALCGCEQMPYVLSKETQV